MVKLDCPLFRPINLDECFANIKNKRLQESISDASNCQTQWFYTSIPVKEDDPEIFYRGPSLISVLSKSDQNIDIVHKEPKELFAISKNLLSQPIALPPNHTKLRLEIKNKMLDNTGTYDQSLPSGSNVSATASNSSVQKRSLISMYITK